MAQNYELDDELKNNINNAEAVLVDYSVIHRVTEYLGDDTRLFATNPDKLGYHIVEDNVIATQVGMSALDNYDDVLSLWMEPGYGLVTPETAPDDPDEEVVEALAEDPAKRELNGAGTVDPVADELDLDTLRAVLAVVKGYDDTSPNTLPRELDDYRYGRYEAFMAILGVLSRWIDEIRKEEAGTVHYFLKEALEDQEPDSEQN